MANSTYIWSPRRIQDFLDSPGAGFSHVCSDERGAECHLRMVEGDGTCHFDFQAGWSHYQVKGEGIEAAQQRKRAAAKKTFAKCRRIKVTWEIEA